MNIPPSPLQKGFEVALLSLFLNGKQMQSIIEILVVTVKSGVSKKTSQPYSISEAHCVLRNADGTPGAVGLLVVPKALEVAAVPGLYTATFGLNVPTFGEFAGKVSASLSGLVPISMAQLKPAK
jgi:hypothetical protein